MTSEVKVSDSKEEFQTGSKRDTREGKGRYDLISPLALRRLALRLEGGAGHYGERNWEKGQPLMRYLDSAIRHINNHIEGKRDEDHMGAAMWNIHAFIHTEEAIKRGLLPESLNDCPNFSKVEPDEWRCCFCGHDRKRESIVGSHEVCRQCGQRVF